MPATDYGPLFLISFLAISPAMAQQTDSGLAGCARIADAGQRLACYDRLAGVAPAISNAAAVATRTSSPAAVAAVDAPPVPAAVDASPATTRDFSLIDHWELDQEHKRGVFNFRPHLVNYLMLTRTAHPNNEPYRPFRRLDVLTSDLAHSELVFQLGFKMKLVENALGKPVDLWFGYTQNSFWQAGNHEASSPFRETNYQPELMAVTPLHFSVLGMNARFLNLGLVHQSNGQVSTLSRSWNRVYAQVGLERQGGLCWAACGNASTRLRPTTTIATSSTTWGAATSSSRTAAMATITRPYYGAISRRSAAPSCSAGHSRWPDTSRDTPICSRATDKA
jgi:phospholipase A1/A2